jgi:hypothetical protein
MVYEAVAVVVVLLGCTAFLARLIGHLAGVIDLKVRELDQNVAAAIQNTVAQLPLSDFEAPNPVQAALAQFLMSRIQPESNQLLNRAADGTFAAKVISEVQE